MIDKSKAEEQVRNNFRIVYNGYLYKLQEKKKRLFSKKEKWVDLPDTHFLYSQNYPNANTCLEKVCGTLELLIKQRVGKIIGFHEVKNPCQISESLPKPPTGGTGVKITHT